MQLTKKKIDSWSTPSSTMASNINYKDTLFERANLTPIRGKPTFKTLHKSPEQDKSKRQVRILKSRRRSTRPPCPSDHLCTVRTHRSHSFVYSTHPGPLIIPDGTNVHENSNMWIKNTKEVRLFREVTGVEQAVVQKIVGTIK